QPSITALQNRPVRPKTAWMFWRQIQFLPTPYLSEDELMAEINNATQGNPEDYTLAALEAFLWHRVQGTTRNVPLLRPAYHRVCAALQRTLPLPDRRIRPSRALCTLSPEQDRKALWIAFHQTLGVRAPALEEPYHF